MSISAKHVGLVALAALLATGCGDGPADVQGPPEVTFELTAPRPAFLTPFTASRTGRIVSMIGTIVLPCAPFTMEGDAWHDDDADALFVRFVFVSEENCIVEGNASYTAQITNAAGSSRFRVIHEWPDTIPPDTVFKATFESGG